MYGDLSLKNVYYADINLGLNSQTRKIMNTGNIMLLCSKKKSQSSIRKLNNKQGHQLVCGFVASSRLDLCFDWS